MMKVFLGGTCNNSTWRDALIPKLKIEYFNPVVENWTEASRLEEERQKKLCDIHLYVLTNKQKGVYSFAEILDSANKNPHNTLIAHLPDFDKKEKSLFNIQEVLNLAQENGAILLSSIDEIAFTLNKKEKEETTKAVSPEIKFMKSQIHELQFEIEQLTNENKFTKNNLNKLVDLQAELTKMGDLKAELAKANKAVSNALVVEDEKNKQIEILSQNHVTNTKALEISNTHLEELNLEVKTYQAEKENLQKQLDAIADKFKEFLVEMTLKKTKKNRNEKLMQEIIDINKEELIKANVITEALKTKLRLVLKENDVFRKKIKDAGDFSLQNASTSSDSKQKDSWTKLATFCHQLLTLKATVVEENKK